jgi:predicted O-methyltransferase YrrM
MSDGIVISKQVKDFCNGSKPPFWAKILFRLIRKFGSVSAVELGSCLGISAAYQAAAQKINGAGKITTLEGAVSLSALTQKHLQQLGLDNATVVQGRFQDNLNSVLQENRPVDYAVIDGHHEEKATIAYFTQILPYLAEEAVIVFDDISWSPGMRKAWEKIVENDQVKIAVDLVSIGICIIDGRIEGKQIYRLPKFSK